MLPEGPVHHRLASRSDLAACRELLPSGLRLGAAVHKGLIHLWADLLATGAIIMHIIEDPARSDASSIEAFGCSVFVTDAFTEDFCSNPHPYLPAIVYEHMLAGRSPVLSVPQIAAANSSTGLNLAVLHFGLRNREMEDDRTQRALQAGSAAFYFAHAGYRINVLINEVYGPQHASYMSTGGFRLFRDFQVAGVPAEQRPYLFAIRKEWMAPGAVSPLSFLFHAPSPQFWFSHAEQGVLFRALANESDAQIAAALRVSLDAVKKTWRRAYEHVALVAPLVLGPAERVPASDHRGMEKRRYLLEYLRGHLEELRPLAYTITDNQSWRELSTVQLLFRDPKDTILWLQFDPARGTFNLIDPQTGAAGTGFLPGSRQRLQTRWATVYLSHSKVDLNVPDRSSVTLTLEMSFKEKAAGRTFDAAVLAKDQLGHSQGPEVAGRLTVTGDDEEAEVRSAR